MQVEQVTDPVAHHGEGPVWSARWGGLRWVDMLAGDVLSLSADGGVRRRHVGSVAAALRPRPVHHHLPGGAAGRCRPAGGLAVPGQPSGRRPAGAGVQRVRRRLRGRLPRGRLRTRGFAGTLRPDPFGLSAVVRRGGS